MLDSSLEDRFGEHLVDIDSCKLRIHLRNLLELRCEEADVGLCDSHREYSNKSSVLLLLSQVVADHLSRLEAVTDGHVNVHNDQLVARARPLEAVLNHIEAFLAIRRQVVLNLQLFQLRRHGQRAEKVVIDYENLHVFIVDVCPASSS